MGQALYKNRLSLQDIYAQVDSLISDNIRNGYVLIHQRKNSPSAGIGTISYVTINTVYRGSDIGAEIEIPIANPGINFMFGVDSNNNGVMIWATKFASGLVSNGTHNIWVSRLSITNGTPTWGEPIKIFTLYGVTDTIGLEKPQVSFNSSGQAVAVWNDSDKIYAIRFLRILYLWKELDL